MQGAHACRCGADAAALRQLPLSLAIPSTQRPDFARFPPAPSRAQVLPLTRQLTTIAGNLWAHSLKGQRAERIEFLLLHEVCQARMCRARNRGRAACAALACSCCAPLSPLSRVVTSCAPNLPCTLNPAPWAPQFHRLKFVCPDKLTRKEREAQASRKAAHASALANANGGGGAPGGGVELDMGDDDGARLHSGSD